MVDSVRKFICTVIPGLTRNPVFPTESMVSFKSCHWLFKEALDALQYIFFCVLGFQLVVDVDQVVELEKVDAEPIFVR
jgi:hypothetical protein